MDRFEETEKLFAEHPKLNRETINGLQNYKFKMLISNVKGARIWSVTDWGFTLVEKGKLKSYRF